MMLYGDLMRWVTSVQMASAAYYGKPMFVWRTGTADETAQWVVAQYRFWNDKKFEQHKSIKAFNVSGWNAGSRGPRGRVGFVTAKRRLRATIAACFDGVGFDRAMKLADRFKSPYEMVNADVAQLTGNGVGKKLAEKMYAQIHDKGK